MPLDVVDSRGYNYAEVTAGGIPLSEIDSATMESRVCSRLFLIGEMLDVDGRIGGLQGGQGAGRGAFADPGRAGEDQAVGQAVGGQRAADPGEGLFLVEDGVEGEKHWGNAERGTWNAERA